MDELSSPLAMSCQKTVPWLCHRVGSLTLRANSELGYNTGVVITAIGSDSRGCWWRTMSQPNPGPATPTPGTIPQAEVAVVKTAWGHNPQDLGVGLYNPTTGEIHVGTFDTTGRQIGHDGLQMALRIPDVDRLHWRGFVFTSTGRTFNQSGFNIPDGTPPRMRADFYAQVEDALRRAGLI